MPERANRESISIMNKNGIVATTWTQFSVAKVHKNSALYGHAIPQTAGELNSVNGYADDSRRRQVFRGRDVGESRHRRQQARQGASLASAKWTQLIIFAVAACMTSIIVFGMAVALNH
jgi:hypothetical protein